MAVDSVGVQLPAGTNHELFVLHSETVAILQAAHLRPQKEPQFPIDHGYTFSSGASAKIVRSLAVFQLFDAIRSHFTIVMYLAPTSLPRPICAVSGVIYLVEFLPIHPGTSRTARSGKPLTLSTFTTHKLSSNAHPSNFAKYTRFSIQMSPHRLISIVSTE
jgi:hypothetical protein